MALSAVFRNRIAENPAGAGRLRTSEANPFRNYKAETFSTQIKKEASVAGNSSADDGLDGGLEGFDLDLMAKWGLSLGEAGLRFGVEHFSLPAIVTGCLYLCDIRSLAPLGSTLAPLGSTLAPLGQL